LPANNSSHTVSLTLSIEEGTHLVGLLHDAHGFEGVRAQLQDLLVEAAIDDAHQSDADLLREMDVPTKVQ
jgi:hypothetical protein